MTVELQFITRARCGLCDEALAKLRPLTRWTGVALVVRDAAEMPDAGLADRVPVLIGGGTELHAGPLTWSDAVRVVLRARFDKGVSPEAG